LAKLSVGAFGISEFTLRLPSLLGGALYLWVALALSRIISDRAL
jgi:predicted membrane-bound mannosyltransferase